MMMIIKRKNRRETKSISSQASARGRYRVLTNSSDGTTDHHGILLLHHHALLGILHLLVRLEILHRHGLDHGLFDARHKRDGWMEGWERRTAETGEDTFENNSPPRPDMIWFWFCVFVFFCGCELGDKGGWVRGERKVSLKSSFSWWF